MTRLHVTLHLRSGKEVFFKTDEYEKEMNFFSEMHTRGAVVFTKEDYSSDYSKRFKPTSFTYFIDSIEGVEIKELKEGYYDN